MVHDVNPLRIWGAGPLAKFKRPTDSTRACVEFLILMSSHKSTVSSLEDMPSWSMVQESDRILNMAGVQVANDGGPKHGSPNPQSCCRSVAIRIDCCADIPATRSVPNLWMCISPRPVSSCIWICTIANY